ncbi:MAG: ROK family protein [Ardenticatenia bacterium]|nr:ROK family protein [Ardenticatenia bacterium]
MAGMVIRMPNLPGWHDVPLATLLADALELPARLHNDASLAALGEAFAGAGRGADPLVYLTVSTGIGGGIVIGGRLFEGRHGLAAELGHILPDPAGPTCGLGHAGCLEALASGSALARLARRALAAGEIPSGTPLSAMARAAALPLDAAMLAAAAEHGDAWALATWQSAGRALGRGLASIIKHWPRSASSWAADSRRLGTCGPVGCTRPWPRAPSPGRTAPATSSPQTWATTAGWWERRCGWRNGWVRTAGSQLRSGG